MMTRPAAEGEALAETELLGLTDGLTLRDTDDDGDTEGLALALMDAEADPPAATLITTPTMPTSSPV